MIWIIMQTAAFCNKWIVSTMNYFLCICQPYGKWLSFPVPGKLVRPLLPSAKAMPISIGIRFPTK